MVEINTTLEVNYTLIKIISIYVYNHKRKKMCLYDLNMILYYFLNFTMSLQ